MAKQQTKKVQASDERDEGAWIAREITSRGAPTACWKSWAARPTIRSGGGRPRLIVMSYSAPHTGTPMISVNLAIGIPANTHIALLREEFLDFCDDLNLDAVMEPIKG